MKGKQQQRGEREKYTWVTQDEKANSLDQARMMTGLGTPKREKEKKDKRERERERASL